MKSTTSPEAKALRSTAVISWESPTYSSPGQLQATLIEQFDELR
jgi:hypothetical protein